ncbi:MAG: MerR family transcriptional regulator [Chloracidobacterium sp.]|nr:MerR family transcriptional regulator [Chloracidobacterium sp.]MCC6826573.1 MerR family transcriptional regulator [Acidobacteriota bacterium]
MAPSDVVIPDKIFFKIGEVCQIVGVQAHVLRYWESEFPMLSPQKNSSGQRSYRKKDVEVAVKIKQLLYNEMFTIAGARKKLQIDAREAAGAKTVVPAPAVAADRTPKAAAPKRDSKAPMLFDTSPIPEAAEPLNGIQAEVLKRLAMQVLELRDMLKRSGQ